MGEFVPDSSLRNVFHTFGDRGGSGSAWPRMWDKVAFVHFAESPMSIMHPDFEPVKQELEARLRPRRRIKLSFEATHGAASNRALANRHSFGRRWLLELSVGFSPQMRRIASATCPSRALESLVIDQIARVTLLYLYGFTTNTNKKLK